MQVSSLKRVLVTVLTTSVELVSWSCDSFKDMIDEFVAVWQWKPEGKLTEDELTLKADGILTLKREGQGAAGTWNVAEPKGGGRNLVKIKLSVEPFSSIEMERISLTTLRSTSGPQRAVLKDSLDDCLYVEYFEFPEGLDTFKKPPPLLGRKPDISRSEQQIDWVKTDSPPGQHLDASLTFEVSASRALGALGAFECMFYYKMHPSNVLKSFIPAEAVDWAAGQLHQQLCSEVPGPASSSSTAMGRGPGQGITVFPACSATISSEVEGGCRDHEDG